MTLVISVGILSTQKVPLEVRTVGTGERTTERLRWWVVILDRNNSKQSI
jgi:hypothetical protein